MKNIKEGASIRGLNTEILIAWDIADAIYEELGNKYCTLTSGTDGKHSRTSKHYEGDAIDIRTREFALGGNNSSLVKRAVTRISELLGKDYDVIFEKNHIHIEYQPKGSLI